MNALHALAAQSNYGSMPFPAVCLFAACSYYLGAYDGDDLDPNLLLPARPAPRRLPPPRGAHSSQQQQGVAAAAVLQAS